MKTPVYTRYEYVDATAFSLAASQLASNVALIGDAAVIGGLVNNSQMSTSSSGLVLTVNLPAPFGIITNSGILAQAHGTVSNQDTSTYTVNFASFVPGSGSQTVYLIATVISISQDPYQVIGPPAGHPSYVANFVPFTAYATTVDSFTLTATTTPPNNTTHFELGRFTLSAGASTLPALSTINQILAAPLPVQNVVPVASNKTLTVADAGVGQRADATVVFTLPDAGVANGYSFTVIGRGGAPTVQRSTSGNLIYGTGNDPSVGATSFVVALGNTVTLTSDGSNYQLVASNFPAGTTNFVSVSVAGNANVTLTAAQAACTFIALTGVLTGNISVLLPNGVTGTWVLRNQTTGAFTITLQYVSGGQTVVLNSGTTFVAGTGGGVLGGAQNFITQANNDASNLAATTAFVHNYVGSITVVNTFNGRSGTVALTSGDVTTALGFSPVQSFNTRTGVVTLTSGDVTTALGFTPVNSGSSTIVGSTDQLAINDAAGIVRRFQINTAGTARWRWGGDAATESGGNAGTNWFLQAFTDGGGVLGFAITANRATRIVDFPAGITMPNQSQGDNSNNGANTHYVDTGLATTLSSAQSYTNGYALALTGGTVSGNLTVGDGTGTRQIIINGAVNTFRTLFYQTNGSNRWHLRCNSTAESGSNAGSDFSLVRYADDGVTVIGTPISIIRSTGVVSISQLVTTTQSAGDNSTNAATTRYADLAASNAQTAAINTIQGQVTGANQSLVTNGFQALLGGAQLIWGQGTCPNSGGNTSSLAITFAGGGFATACFGVVVTALGSANSTSGGWPSANGSSISKTGFTAILDTLGYTTINRTIPITWMAWGH